MDASHAPVLSVAEIRDYERINIQLAQMLDDGQTRIRLAGVDGQRLLVSGLRGNWSAVVEIEGNTGPELAACLDAPNLIVLARGSAADGAGRSLRAGSLLVFGESGDATAYRQSGGVVVVLGTSGHRAGLELSGGTLIVGGPTGRLLADRQCGGRIIALHASHGANVGHGRTGGRLISPSHVAIGFDPLTTEDAAAFQESIRGLAPWLPHGFAVGVWPKENAG